jgi:hypothetical protein
MGPARKPRPDHRNTSLAKLQSDGDHAETAHMGSDRTSRNRAGSLCAAPAASAISPRPSDAAPRSSKPRPQRRQSPTQDRYGTAPRPPWRQSRPTIPATGNHRIAAAKSDLSAEMEGSGTRVEIAAQGSDASRPKPRHLRPIIPHAQADERGIGQMERPALSIIQPQQDRSAALLARWVMTMHHRRSRKGNGHPFA